MLKLVHSSKRKFISDLDLKETALSSSSFSERSVLVVSSQALQAQFPQASLGLLDFHPAGVNSEPKTLHLKKKAFIEERVDRQKKLAEEKLTRVPPMLPTPPLRKDSPIFSTARPAPVAGMKTVELLLKYVVEGEQNKVKALLESNAELALQKGNVTDLSKREFKNITGFQYALWALDWHMGKAILEYIPKGAAALQLAEWEAKETVYGQQFSLAPLIEALNTYAKHYHEWDRSKCQQYWCKAVGRNQWLLPVHVVNEYCHPTRKFYPCPKFDEEMLPRSRVGEMGGWYTCVYNRGKLGETFGMLRSNFKTVEMWDLLYWSAESAEIDARALEALWKMRQQQVKSLKSALTVQREPPVGLSPIIQQVEKALSFQEAQSEVKRNIIKEASFYLGKEKHLADKDYFLGICYRRGCGVLIDQKKTVEHLQRAAQAGHPRACYYLGNMYKYGEGVPRSKEQANALFRACIEAIKKQATSKEDGWGAFILGSMYEEGNGISQNREEASQWYQASLPWLHKVAEQGHTVAQVNLGFCYENGQGVHKDEKAAVIWYDKAAKQGHAYAQEKLGEFYANGQGVTKDEKAAIVWYRKAAEQGHVSAKTQLDDLLRHHPSLNTPLTDFFATADQRRLSTSSSGLVTISKIQQSQSSY